MFYLQTPTRSAMNNNLDMFFLTISSYKGQQPSTWCEKGYAANIFLNHETELNRGTKMS